MGAIKVLAIITIIKETKVDRLYDLQKAEQLIITW